MLPYVLNACQTAALSSTRPLVGLAPRLLQRELAAVLAMQYPVAERTAQLFTREFYRTLVTGATLERAVQDARRALYQDLGPGQRDWAIPVLFLRSDDSRLLVEEQPGRGGPGQYRGRFGHG